MSIRRELSIVDKTCMTDELLDEFSGFETMHTDKK